MKNTRPEIKFKGQGGITDVFDDFIKGAFNITDEEYDFICENASEKELDELLGGLGSSETLATFSEKKKSLEVRNKYLDLYGRERKEL
jgi:oligoribonuclease NrnB/cAMP/cGMP phosphodiesterase (DHH superfamily)